MPTTYWLQFGNTPLGYNGKALKTEYAVPGRLSITCNASISGSGFDTTKQFGCTITFDAVVPYTLDGVAQTPALSVHLLLVKDQTALIGNLPVGTTYSIVEDTLSAADNARGYTNGTVTGATGTIAEDTTSTAALGFVYAEIEVMGLRLTTMGTMPEGTTIPVNITLNKAVFYTIDGVEVSSPSDTISVTVPLGETVELGGLPAGSFTAVFGTNATQVEYTNMNASGTVSTGVYGWSAGYRATLYNHSGYTAEARIYEYT